MIGWLVAFPETVEAQYLPIAGMLILLSLLVKQILEVFEVFLKICLTTDGLAGQKGTHVYSKLFFFLSLFLFKITFSVFYLVL